MTVPEPATTSKAKPKSDVWVFGDLKPCELVRADQLSYPLGTPKEQKDYYGRSLTCHYIQVRAISTSIGFQPYTTPNEWVRKFNGRGKQTPVTIGKHTGLQHENEVGECSVVLAVGESSGVNINLSASPDRVSLRELCTHAPKVAELVERQLPTG